MGGSMPGAAEQAYEQLRQRVRTLPLPTAPPRYPYVGTSVGVGLLDAAINLDHVARRTERLRIIDLGHLSRDVTLHLSLDRLTPPQRAAAQEYGERRERTRTPGDRRPPIVWVPITRVNRLFASPVRIFDNEGREVPRATQPELLPLINAAMYRLLRLLLLSQAESRGEHAPGGERAKKTDSGSLHRVLFETDRARWLLQQAVASMIYDTYQVRSRLDARRGDEGAAERVDALDVIDSYLTPEKQAAFLELLHHTSTEYLVLAGLTSDKKEHYLSYSAAALPSRPRGGRWLSSLRGLWRGLSPLGCEFTLRYETQLPSNLESFHVTVETDGQTRIREALLVTAHDRTTCHGVLTRLRTFGGPDPDLPEGIRRYQLGAALVDLSTLIDARMNDSDGYVMQFEQRHPPPAAAGNGSIPNDRLVQLSQDLGRVGHDRLLAGSHEPDLDTSRLARAVDGLDLGDASVMDDDPRGHVAHMFWRRRRPSARTLSSGDATAEVQVVVADQRPPLSRSIVAWLGMLFALVAVTGLLAFGRFGWPLPNPLSDDQIAQAFAADGQTGEALGGDSADHRSDPTTAFDGMESDALIAVLLIVPGWLLLQLGGLPTKRSLSSRLRMLESSTAFVAIVATAALALIVATRSDDKSILYRSFVGVPVVLLLLLVVSGIERAANARKEHRSRVELLSAPRWLHERPSRLRHPLRSGPRAFDAEFESVGHWAAVKQLQHPAPAAGSTGNQERTTDA